MRGQRTVFTGLLSFILLASGIISSLFFNIDAAQAVSEKSVPEPYLAEKKFGNQPKNMSGEAIFQIYCVACHGKGAKGGVININYIKGTVPALNTLAERMFLDEPENANKVANLLDKNVDITKMNPKLDVPHQGRVLAQYRAIKKIIQNGSIAGKKDPKGPAPLFNMPSWANNFTQQDIDHIISYLLKLYPWEKVSDE